MVAISEDLRSVIDDYRKTRLKIIEESKKLEEYSLILFKSFLKYLKRNKDEKKGFHELLNDFLSSELGLDPKKDASVRLSLIRRFYNMATKRTRDEKIQKSLLLYLE